MSDLAEDVARIARVVAARVDGVEPLFAGPASAAAIAQAEASLGVMLPDEVRALYALADGQTDAGPSLLDAFTLMPLAEVVDAAAFLNDFFPDGRNEEDPDHAPIEADAGIRPAWWWPKWVPLMTNGGGDYYCVDLDPAEGGMPGQIVAYFHDEIFRSRIAPSMATLVHEVASGLEDGSYGIRGDMIMKTTGG